MKAFALAVAIGAIEAVLLYFLMRSVNSGKRHSARFIMLLKFISYGVIIWLLMNKYLSYYIYCLCGFVTGFPMTGIIIFIYSGLLKGKLKLPFIKKPKIKRKFY